MRCRVPQALSWIQPARLTVLTGGIGDYGLLPQGLRCA